MQATTTGNSIDQKFTLELSSIEMHILMQAMSIYGARHGYGQWDSKTPNGSHADASEKLHDEMTEIYTRDLEKECEPAPSMLPLFAEILNPFGIK